MGETLHPSTGVFCRHCSAWRGSLGLEPDFRLYVEHIVTIFEEVRRVLRSDGVCWLNIGDSYASGGRKTRDPGQSKLHPAFVGDAYPDGLRPNDPDWIKPKDLLGVPWALAFALRDDGWYLRSEIIWAKRAPMPESVTDRPTSAHEKVFLLSKSPRYFYDAEAVKEPNAEPDGSGGWQSYARAWKTGWHARYPKKKINFARQDNTSLNDYQYGIGRNMRNVWLLGPEPFPEAHFAVFPTEIPRRAILAGTSERGVCPKCGAPWARMVERSGEWRAQHDRPIVDGSPYRANPGGGIAGTNTSRLSRDVGWSAMCACDAGDPVPATVLDCFLGAGTTALVADRLGRDCIGIELNESYAAMATRRLRADAGMFADISYGQFVAEAAAAE